MLWGETFRATRKKKLSFKGNWVQNEEIFETFAPQPLLNGFLLIKISYFPKCGNNWLRKNFYILWMMSYFNSKNMEWFSFFSNISFFFEQKAAFYRIFWRSYPHKVLHILESLTHIIDTPDSNCYLLLCRLVRNRSNRSEQNRDLSGCLHLLTRYTMSPLFVFIYKSANQKRWYFIHLFKSVSLCPTFLLERGHKERDHKTDFRSFSIIPKHHNSENNFTVPLFQMKI